VLLAVLRPSQILVGSVIGIGLLTLGQLLALAIPILTAITLTDGLDLPAVAAADIGLGVTWFLIGFLIYAFLFAATAALVDKMTDVGSATMPVTVILVLSYITAVIMVPMGPDSPLSTALSIFPLTAPMAMPIRWASGSVPVWQLAATMLLALATAVLLARLGSSVYQRALVVTGRRLKLREVLQERR
jgi:ABC-2 type transport system permease protein